MNERVLISLFQMISDIYEADELGDMYPCEDKANGAIDLIYHSKLMDKEHIIALRELVYNAVKYKENELYSSDVDIPKMSDDTDDIPFDDDDDYILNAYKEPDDE